MDDLQESIFKIKVSSSTHRFVAFFAGTLQKDQTRWSYFENYCVAGVFGGRLFVEWLVIELRDANHCSYTTMYTRQK